MATSRNLKQFPNNTGQKYDNKVARNESRAHETFYEPKFDDVVKEEKEGTGRLAVLAAATKKKVSSYQISPWRRVNELGRTGAEFPFHYARDSIRREFWRRDRDKDGRGREGRVEKKVTTPPPPPPPLPPIEWNPLHDRSDILFHKVLMVLWKSSSKIGGEGGDQKFSSLFAPREVTLSLQPKIVKEVTK